MAEGWKQVWEDILNSLRGEAKPVEQISPPDSSSEAVSQPIEDSTQPGTAVLEMPSTEPPVDVVEHAVESSSPSLEMETTEEQLAESVEGEITTVEPSAPARSRSDQIRTFASYLVLVLVLLVGLWFSGGNRFLAQLSAPQAPAPDVVATFNGGQIAMADVEAHLSLLVPEELREALRSTDALAAVIEDMVTDELARRWAVQRQPDTDETFTHTMEHITEDINLQSFELQLHESDIPVTESEIQAYYNNNRDQFGDQTLDTVREQIRQLLVSEREETYLQDYIQRLKDNASITRNFELLDVPPPGEQDLRQYYEDNVEQFMIPRQVIVHQLEFSVGEDEAVARQTADDALLDIRSGASFEEVSQNNPDARLSTDVTIREETNDPAWDTAVFALTEDEMSNVFRAGDSFYIVRLNALQAARTQTLDEAREIVAIFVEQQIAEDWFQTNANRTLLTLKGRQYTLGQFYQEYQELPLAVQAQFAGPEGMRQMAELLIERLLLVEDTYDQLLNTQNQALTDEARLQVLKQLLHQEEVDDKIEVTEEEIQQFYDENIELMAPAPSARIRYIRIGLGVSEDEAQRARERADEAYRRLVPGVLQTGEDFAAIAQEYSEDPETAANGGELPGRIGETGDILAELEQHPFHEMILPLQPGEISPPFEFGDSLYIVQVIEWTDPEALSIEEARPYIEEILTEQKHDELAAKLQISLLEEANVVIYWNVLEGYLTQLDTPAPAITEP